jgi:hypothetical protein
VHRRDLVISTMGRSFWIMDNVTPLQQIALGLRGGTATSAGSDGGHAGATVAAAGEAFSATSAAYLFEPRAAYRMRYTPQMGEPDQPEYPPVGAQIDYFFASEPAGEVKIEILDAGGKVLRGFTSEGPAPRTGTGQEMRMAMRFGFGGMTRVPKKAGANRFVWDLRYPGPWDRNTPAGGAGGPHVAPGTYQVRLTAAGTSLTRTLEVKIDPRVTADGVTQADLQEQADLLLRVRDAISAGRKFQDRLAQAMEKAGVKPPPPPAPGETPGTVKYASPLQATWAKLVTAPAPYPQPMLIDQFTNIARMLAQADQKPGKDAWDRYTDLAKDLAAIEGEVEKLAPAQ